ncbi:MAG: (d)CMP kinase [Muribaculaceae bacterium]|nr:(d)CMP kinase [Muribaculaceae bacterium]
MKKIIVAIDGFSSSGKSTMARQLARETGYLYVDSGAMYRAVTLYALRNGLVGPDRNLDVAALVAALPHIDVAFSLASDGNQHTLLNGEDVEREIRLMEVSEMVSPVAAVPEVRRYLTRLQQGYGVEKGIVMDGRDIGTTVFPDAEMKVFVNASPEVRAQRRVDELRAKGERVEYADVLANVMERDRIDSTREESPLRQAPDALVLDNDRLTREEQMQWLLDKFHTIAGD